MSLKAPWPSKGLLDLLITLICATVTSIVAVIFKNYYTALILIILFLIITIVVLIIFYIELRLTYNQVIIKQEDMIDTRAIQNDQIEEEIKKTIRPSAEIAKQNLANINSNPISGQSSSSQGHS